MIKFSSDPSSIFQIHTLILRHAHKRRRFNWLLITQQLFRSGLRFVAEFNHMNIKFERLHGFKKKKKSCIYISSQLSWWVSVLCTDSMWWRSALLLCVTRSDVSDVTRREAAWRKALISVTLIFDTWSDVSRRISCVFPLVFQTPSANSAQVRGSFLLRLRPGRIEGRDLHTCDHIHMRPEHETRPSVRDHRGESKRGKR